MTMRLVAVLVLALAGARPAAAVEVLTGTLKRVAERGAPAGGGEGRLGLQAQAGARHDPDHALDRAGRDQGRGGDDRQQALAAAGCKSLTQKGR